MGKARQRKETGKLYLDFFDQGLQLREQAALKDTPANRKNAHRLP
ncbi:Arm DNA-binding domain-containing protein [Vreelandella venusta]